MITLDERFGTVWAMAARRQQLDKVAGTFFEVDLRLSQLRVTDDYRYFPHENIEDFIELSCEGAVKLRWINNGKNMGAGTFRLSFANRDDRTLFWMRFPEK